MNIDEMVSQAIEEANLTKSASYSKQDSNIDLVSALYKMAQELEEESFLVEGNDQSSASTMSKLASMVAYNRCVKEANDRIYDKPYYSQDQVEKCAAELEYKDAYLNALNNCY